MAEPKETVAPDEAARFQKYAEELRELQKKRAKGGAPSRALHVKAHAGVRAVLDVKAGLAPELAQGVFAEPRSYDAYVRFSNGGARTLPDTINEIRGVAVKLVGVAGKKIIPGLEDKQTQDFLFIQTPALAVRDPDEFMTVVRYASQGPAKLLLGIAKHHGVGRMIGVARAGTSMKFVSSMATGTFHTGAPIRWGPGAAKLSLVPVAGDAPRGQGKSAIRDDVRARLKDGPIVYSVRAQLYVDEQTTPIEDASKLWPEAKAPFREVGTLTVLQQDMASPRGKDIEELVEKLSFDPWHALEAHRPLGAIMRARAPAYKESVIARGAADEPSTALSVNE